MFAGGRDCPHWWVVMETAYSDPDFQAPVSLGVERVVQMGAFWRRDSAENFDSSLCDIILEIFKINRGANPAKLFETHFQKHFL
jgi:hypothetical protein